MTLLSLRDAVVRRATGDVRLPDVDVTPGLRLGVVGANGEGKTTLLRALAQLDPVDGRRTSSVAAADVVLVPPRPYLLYDWRAAQWQHLSAARRRGCVVCSAGGYAAAGDREPSPAPVDDVALPPFPGAPADAAVFACGRRAVARSPRNR